LVNSQAHQAHVVFESAFVDIDLAASHHGSGKDRIRAPELLTRRAASGPAGTGQHFG
jgi:hypothetical protein